MSASVKNRVLLNIAEALETNQSAVLEANTEDHKSAKKDGLNEAMLDRLLLTPERLCAMAQDVRGVAALPDPVGESLDMTTIGREWSRHRWRSAEGRVGHPASACTQPPKRGRAQSAQTPQRGRG